MSEPPQVPAQGRIAAEVVAEAGDWQAFEPIEPLVIAAVGGCIAGLRPSGSDTVRDALALGLSRDGAHAHDMGSVLTVSDPEGLAPMMTPTGPLLATIVLGDDVLVRRLNAQFRAKDRPTNVLSFPAQPMPGRPLDPDGQPIGDVVLAVETIAREAAELGIPPRDHLAHLVVHGVLHLLGHDHDTVADAERMEAQETAILAGLGIADPYAGSEPELTGGAVEGPPKGR